MTVIPPHVRAYAAACPRGAGAAEIDLFAAPRDPLASARPFAVGRCGSQGTDLTVLRRYAGGYEKLYQKHILQPPAEANQTAAPSLRRGRSSVPLLIVREGARWGSHSTVVRTAVWCSAYSPQRSLVASGESSCDSRVALTHTTLPAPPVSDPSS